MKCRHHAILELGHTIWNYAGISMPLILKIMYPILEMLFLYLKFRCFTIPVIYVAAIVCSTCICLYKVKRDAKDLTGVQGYVKHVYVRCLIIIL